LSKYGPQNKECHAGAHRAGVLLRRRTTRHKRSLLAVQQRRAPNGAKGARNSGDFVARTAAPYWISIFAIIDIDKTAKRLVILVDDQTAR
jgi:hypothetical protein